MRERCFTFLEIYIVGRPTPLVSMSRSKAKPKQDEGPVPLTPAEVKAKAREFFYKLMGQPPIVVLDKVQSIVIFETNITNDPIPDTTSLGRFLALLTSERFPEPMVYRANIQDIYKSNIFDDKDEIIKYLSKLL